MTGSTKYLYMWSAGRLTDGADVFEDRALAVPTEHLPAVDAAPGNRMHVRDLRCLAGEVGAGGAQVKQLQAGRRQKRSPDHGFFLLHLLVDSSWFTESCILLCSPSHGFCLERKYV